MQHFEAWCRDPRPLTFGEFLEERRREREDWASASPIEEQVANVYQEWRRRVGHGQRYAVCYVSIDHFKEYHDRYGCERGQRVISMLSRILRDAVPTDDVVAHVGGDDFNLLLAASEIAGVCGEVCDAFDRQVPLQYDASSAKEPLMALSIGVVTNEQCDFTHFAEITERVLEMHGYARTLPYSVFVVDRRTPTVAS
jgi:diguanylate cyclase (GGDEF)-like protein